MKRNSKINISSALIVILIYVTVFFYYAIKYQLDDTKIIKSQPVFTVIHTKSKSKAIKATDISHLRAAKRAAEKAIRHKNIMKQVHAINKSMTKVHQYIKKQKINEQAKDALKRLEKYRAIQPKKGLEEYKETKKQKFSKSDIETVFATRITENIPANGINKHNKWFVTVNVTLDIDGNIATISVISSSNDTPTWFEREVIRTIKRSAPFDFPVEHYDIWKSNMISVVY